MVTDHIKDFYSDLHFPGRYTQDDLELYQREGVNFNVYLREINRAMCNGLRVLDVGCGTGLVMNTFAMLYPNSEFTGVDFSDSIDYARLHAPNNTHWIKQDFLEVDLEPGGYDVIICCGVLHHIPEHERALLKIKTLMRPGGTLMLALYNPLGKILRHIKRINYNSPTLFEDQENNPFELSFTKGAVLNMCRDLRFHRVQPSCGNHLVNLLSLFNSSNGGLAIYTFTND